MMFINTCVGIVYSLSIKHQFALWLDMLKRTMYERCKPACWCAERKLDSVSHSRQIAVWDGKRQITVLCMSVDSSCRKYAVPQEIVYQSAWIQLSRDQACNTQFWPIVHLTTPHITDNMRMLGAPDIVQIIWNKLYVNYINVKSILLSHFKDILQE